jgi:hypothetical protein
MRLRLTFALNLDPDAWQRDRLVAQLPLDHHVHETTARLLHSATPGLPSLPLVVECPIERVRDIGVIESTFMYRLEDVERDDPRPMMIVECPEQDLLELRAEEIAGAMSLVLGCPVGVGMLFGEIPEVDHRLIPETVDDDEVLADIGHPVVFPTMRGETDETALDSPLTGELVGRLAERPGLRLYWEARHAVSPVMQFRELWRTLEMALGAHGKALVGRLAAHPAARTLGFDREELDHHLTLRNRASHANGGSANQEAIRVHHWSIERVGRLHALVELVLADELIPFRGDRAPRNFNRQWRERPVQGGR